MEGILVVDKAAGMTSHDVVGRVRRIFSERRVGHGGTLDPMATGVLPLFVGRATRAVEFAAGADKEYVATMRTGLTTDTQDLTGTVLSRTPGHVTGARVEALLPEFTGALQQVPPMYSAVKQGGKKLYELARQGITVERRPRQIEIHSLTLLSAREEEGEFTLKVVCSKGTYVRTLVHDLGAALGCGAALSALRRTRAGRFTLEEAVTLEELQDRGRDFPLLPVDALFSQYPALSLDTAQEARCRNGADIALSAAPGDGLWRVYAPDGAFLMLGRAQDTVLKTEKNFFAPKD